MLRVRACGRVYSDGFELRFESPQAYLDVHALNESVMAQGERDMLP